MANGQEAQTIQGTPPYSMKTLNASLVIFVFVQLVAGRCVAQQREKSIPCATEYENHNQIDYGPLVVQQVKGTVTDPGDISVPKACVAIYTENDHRLVAATESDRDGNFSLPSVVPGSYRLVVKVDQLCAANARLQIVKHQRKNRILVVHMKPRGLDTCSYAEVTTRSSK